MALRLRYLCLLILLVTLGMWGAPAVYAAPALQEEAPVYIYFFWGDGCPHCEEAKPFLEDLARRHPNVEVASYEVWYDAENQALFHEMAAAQDFEPQYVPTIIIGERHWAGFSNAMRDEIEAAVEACLQDGCPDPGAGIIAGHDARPDPSDPASPEGQSPASAAITLPLLGRVDLGAQSLWVSTALISFADGFNPCSLWVLSILIALTLRTGSRKRILTIGLIYITVTAGIYVLFIAGLFTFLTIVSFLSWIQAAVSALALFFAAVNVKDYFWYKEGLSFTIADEKKPGIYKRIRRVLNTGDSFGALVGATVALGVGVSFVEFSCTAGFPVVWTNLVSAQGVTPLTFVLLLLLYMVIYQIDELAIFGVAVLTLRASRLEEKHGRILKLFGGTLMLSLAVTMLVAPSLMNNLGTALLIFGVAIGVAFLILVIHRHLLPRLGIYIGTEFSQ